MREYGEHVDEQYWEQLLLYPLHHIMRERDEISNMLLSMNSNTHDHIYPLCISSFHQVFPYVGR